MEEGDEEREGEREGQREGDCSEGEREEEESFFSSFIKRKKLKKLESILLALCSLPLSVFRRPVPRKFPRKTERKNLLILLIILHSNKRN